MKQLLSYLFSIIFLVGISSCDRRKVFEDYRELSPAGWNKDSVVVFQFPIKDTTRNNNLFVDIRNKGNYPYSNLWLFLSVASPDGKVHTDTVEFTLAEPSGRWKGSGLGGLYDSKIRYKSSVYFPHKGEYKISIKQGMRDNVLKGIHDIGVRVEKTY